MTHVAIAGAGAVAFTSACQLRYLGNDVTLWSPSGEGTRGVRDGTRITTTGGLNGSFDVKVVEDPVALCEAAEIVLVAVPAYGQKIVFDRLVPCLRDGHTVILCGGQMSFSPLYLSRSLAEAGKYTKFAVLNGPMTAGRKLSPTEVVQPPPRTKMSIVAIPSHETENVLGSAESAFGKRFDPKKNALEVVFGVIGGVVHSALTLCNLTRIEFGEEWCGYRNTTEAVSRLTEALDKERVAVAGSYGLTIPDLLTMFAGGGQARTVQEVMQPLTYQRTFRNGPRDINTRYIEEEIPYNLASLELLAGKTAVATPMITNMIDTYSVIRGKAYRGLNPMAKALGIGEMSPDDVIGRFENGYRPA